MDLEGPRSNLELINIFGGAHSGSLGLFDSRIVDVLHKIYICEFLWYYTRKYAKAVTGGSRD